jgi:hypothetical protein
MHWWNPIWEQVCIWWDAFGFVGSACAVVVAILHFAKREHREAWRETWEPRIMKWGLVLIVVSFFVSVLVISPRKQLAVLEQENNKLRTALLLEEERLRVSNLNSPEYYAGNADVEFRAGNYEFACQCLDLLMSDKSPPDHLVFKEAPFLIYCTFMTNADHTAGSPAEGILMQSFNKYTNEISRAVTEDADNCRNNSHNLSNALETLTLVAHRATNETVFMGQVILTVESLQEISIKHKR